MPTGTGYTSISDYLAANAGTLANEQAALAGDVGGQLSSAQAADDAVIGKVAPSGGAEDYTTTPGYLDALAKQKAANASASELGSQGGVADLLSQHYGKGDSSYTQDRSYWDAGLLGPQAHSSLGDYLNAGASSAANKPPPTPPPTAGPPVEPPPAPPPDYGPPQDWPGGVVPTPKPPYPPPPPPTSTQGGSGPPPNPDDDPEKRRGL